MSLLNGIHSYGNWSYIYLATPAEVNKLRNTLKEAGIKVSHMIKKSGRIVGLNAKVSESAALTYVNSIKK